MINALNSHVTDQCMADSRALYKGTTLWHCVLATYAAIRSVFLVIEH